jgi:hypothetical protein
MKILDLIDSRPPPTYNLVNIQNGARVVVASISSTLQYTEVPIIFPGGTFVAPVSQQAVLEYSSASPNERDTEVSWYRNVYVGLWFGEALINDGYYPDMLPNHKLQRNDLEVGQQFFIEEYARSGFSTAKQKQTLGLAFVSPMYSAVAMG